MKKSGFVSVLTFLVLLVSMSIAMIVPVSAASAAFSYNLGNTGKTYNTYTGGTNKKVYSEDDATVRIESGSGPGYGFAFIIQYKNITGYHSATDSSTTYWLNGPGVVYLAYASGQNKTGRDYYVAARIDDDYNGQYSCTGYFNADYVD